MTISGRLLTLFFTGAAFPGLYQFNIALPSGLGTGDQPLAVTLNGFSTPSGLQN